jgi:hypothetical protein
VRRVLRVVWRTASSLAVLGVLAAFRMTAAAVVIGALIIFAGVLCWVLADEQRPALAAQLLAAGRGDPAAGPAPQLRPQSLPASAPGPCPRRKAAGQPELVITRRITRSAGLILLGIGLNSMLDN